MDVFFDVISEYATFFLPFCKEIINLFKA